MAQRMIAFLALAGLALALTAGLVGCGPKPPCEGATVTQVQSAQDECDAAREEVEAAREELAELEAEVTKTKSEISELEGQPAMLADRLEELRKGSGR